VAPGCCGVCRASSPIEGLSLVAVGRKGQGGLWGNQLRRAFVEGQRDGDVGTLSNRSRSQGNASISPVSLALVGVKGRAGMAIRNAPAPALR